MRGKGLAESEIDTGRGQYISERFSSADRMWYSVSFAPARSGGRLLEGGDGHLAGFILSCGCLGLGGKRGKDGRDPGTTTTERRERFASRKKGREFDNHFERKGFHRGQAAEEGKLGSFYWALDRAIQP